MKSGTCTLLSGVGRNWICGLGVCCPKLAFSGEAEGKISKRRLRKSLVNQVSSTCPSSKCHPERNRPCTDFFAGQSLLPPTPSARLGAVYRGLALQVQNALKKTLRLTPFVASRRPRSRFRMSSNSLVRRNRLRWLAGTQQAEARDLASNTSVATASLATLARG